ncbi:MAG: hypothetical protein GYB33_06355 [Gammaproteobacteria bacterium]|nr:hypothetical protein [Gammaproteobacteria bacterium]
MNDSPGMNDAPVLNDSELLDIRTPELRALTYGRLAQAFVYPEKGHETLLAAVDYTEAFDPAASPVACSLREYNYRKDIHPTSLNEELLRFYQFFGLGRSEQALMPDHIVVELEFMQFLNALESSARQRGEDVTSLQRAQRDFLDRHLGPMARGLVRALRVDTPACRALVEMFGEVIATDLERLQNEVGLADDSAA